MKIVTVVFIYYIVTTHYFCFYGFDQTLLKALP